jgi:hypothetical protein
MSSQHKKAPVNGYSPGIPWEIHLQAYAEYCKRYRPQPALLEGNCRGGFSTGELDMFLPDWRRMTMDLTRQKLNINMDKDK